MNVQHKSLVREIDNKMYVGRDQWIFGNQKKRNKKREKKIFAPK